MAENTAGRATLRYRAIEAIMKETVWVLIVGRALDTKR
jgi:hypothetical protein